MAEQELVPLKPESASNPIYSTVTGVRSNNDASDELNQNESSNAQNSDVSQTNQHSERNAQQVQRGNSTHLYLGEIHSFLKRKNQFCNCDAIGDISVETNTFGEISNVKCNQCGKTAVVDPWWMFDEYEDAKEDIFRFLRYQNPTKTLWHKDHCETNDEADIVPSQIDRFGIVSSVGCPECGKEMSLGTNTATSHTLTVIETVKDVKPGDEIMFRRCYGISHHAICIKNEKSQNENNSQGDGACSPEVTPEVVFESDRCCRRYRKLSSEVKIDVISYNFDKPEGTAGIVEGKESVEGVDIFRVDYDCCYPPKWTEWNVKRAKKFAESRKKEHVQGQVSKSQEALEANYDPFIENCEHFARRCKTGQSESKQAKASINDCCVHTSTLAIRLAILSTWWITEAVIKDTELKQTETNGVLQKAQRTYTRQDLFKMEVILSASLCCIFFILKVLYTSIGECRKVRRRQEQPADEKNPDIYTRNTEGICDKRCCKCCTECCCNCYAKQHNQRYLCRLLFCLVPRRMCNEICRCICLHITCKWCSCESKCKSCCSDPILKFCCRQYVVIVLRVIISEVIVLGGPIIVFVVFEMKAPYSAFTDSSPTRAAAGFGITCAFVLVLSAFHPCISNCLSLTIGWLFLHCCCCCYCCCTLRDPWKFRVDKANFSQLL